jgi:hypothetical protein
MRVPNRLHRQPGQRGGYETNAAKAGCARSTVAEAIKAPEFAGC